MLLEKYRVHNSENNDFERGSTQFTRMNAACLGQKYLYFFFLTLFHGN